MKVKVRLNASKEVNNITVDVKQDLDLSELEWEQLSQSDKETILNNFVESLPEQPYWYVESFNDNQP